MAAKTKKSKAKPKAAPKNKTAKKTQKKKKKGSSASKKQKTEDQIKVIIKRFPVAGEVGIYKRFRFKEGSTEVIYENEKILSDCVASIENFSLAGKKIDTVEKLLTAEDTRLYDLIVDIRLYLLKESEELEEGEA